MTKDDKIRACYQHCCLKYVAFEDMMTNRSLRERFRIDKESYPLVSKVIKDAQGKGLIKPFDTGSRSRKFFMLRAVLGITLHKHHISKLLKLKDFGQKYGRFGT